VQYIDGVVVIIGAVVFHEPATTETHTLSLQDALPISPASASTAMTSSQASPSRAWPSTRRAPATARARSRRRPTGSARTPPATRSEEHTSELQSRENLVYRLLLEQKNRIFSSRKILDK